MGKFKSYEQHQGLLLPPYLDDLIGERDMVRVVDEVVDHLDGSALKQGFQEDSKGGAPAFDPRMMLKILLYAYCCGIRSCRKIARAVRRDIAFMWLAALQQPDFRTINRFRGVYLKEALEEVFAQLVILLEEEGYVTFEDVFVDGSTFEADANQYKMVWKKNTKRFQEQVRERVRKTLEEVERLNEAEDAQYGERDLPECGESSELTGAAIRETAESIKSALQEGKRGISSDEVKECKRQAKQLEKDAEKLEKYEEQRRILGDRNSYSKTDPDASAMRMKNGETRPAYNVQVQAENGFVTNLHVSQNANDGTSFLPLLEGGEDRGLPQPERIMGDAGYGHEENYAALEERGIEAYLKYPAFHAEISSRKEYDYHVSRFQYDEERDLYVCPQGQDLTFKEESQRTSRSGYVMNLRHYQCQACSGCEKRDLCTKSKTGRTIQVNTTLQSYQQQARSRLESDKGEELRKKRGNAVESVFGDWKRNQGFRRFQLRGLAKVTAEGFLHAISHNLRRLFTLKQEEQAEQPA